MSLAVDNNRGGINQNSNLCSTTTNSNPKPTTGGSTTTTATSPAPPPTTTATTNEELINECKKLFDKIDNLCKSGAAVSIPPPHGAPYLNLTGRHGDATTILHSMENANLEPTATTTTTSASTNQTILVRNSNDEGTVASERRLQISMTPATGQTGLVTIVEGQQQENSSSLRAPSAGQFGQQQQQNIFTEEELRLLVCELKRKVEYIENMNWLCLTKRPSGPPHRKSSLPKHTDVKKRFLEICDRTLSDEVKSALRLPAFDSYQWEDAEVLHLMQTMFTELNLIDQYGISVGTLREWLYEVYKYYNEVPFHNFRHCFCVAQMMYAISWHTGLVNRLGALEVLILLVSCICHDLDHPGFNNIYQINARTELALRYNDISPLENHHCSIAFRLLEHPECNIFKTFSYDMFKEIREGIIRCILATDMARHNEILEQFKEISPVFDYSSKMHTNLLCMVLIKVADISNEARPMDVAEPWLDRLLQEFFAQSALEKAEGLPVTPFMDPDKVSKPGSQVRFIGLVLLPLFEALGDLLPELNELIINNVRFALDYYSKLNDAQTKVRRSFVDTSDGGSDKDNLIPRSLSGVSIRSRKSIPSQKSASKNSVDEQSGIAVELHDLPEGSESGDSETATEVDVAEQTSKFKVDTEGNMRCKQSQLGSRKGSKEKRPSMCGEYYISASGRMLRSSHGNIHSYHSNRGNFGANRAVSLDQYGTNNRRMSEGLPAVTSDTQVFYNHHHFQHHQNHNHHHNYLLNNSSETDGTTNSSADAKLNEEDCENKNLSISPCFGSSGGAVINKDQKPPVTSPSHQTNKIQNSTSRDGATKSFITRLRQLTGRFSFSFDKDSVRRIGGPCGGSGVSAGEQTLLPTKNNNAEPAKGGGGGYCCSITASPNLKPKNEFLIQANQNAARNRAQSLDVPPNRNRYSCSSGDGSRKSSSSRIDDNSRCLLSDPIDDNNSNNKDAGDDIASNI